MNWTTFAAVVSAAVAIAVVVIGFIVWAVKQQASQVAKVDRNQASRDEDDVRRRMLEDEERVRKLIAGELAKFQISFGLFLNGTYAKTPEVNARFVLIEEQTKETMRFLTAQDSNGRGLRDVVRHEITDILQIQGAH